jgi:hypothetical protein
MNAANFFIIIVIGIVAFLFIQTSYSQSVKEKRRRNGELLPSQKADRPFNFGEEMVWLAVRADSSEGVAEALGLTDRVRSGWLNAMHYVFEGGAVFVSPVFENWVLVLGIGLPVSNSKTEINKIKLLIDRLSGHYGEAQFYGTYKSCYTFAKSVDGEVVRLYSHNLNNYEFYDIGQPVAEEGGKNFPKIKPWQIEEKDQEYWERNNVTFPDKDIILQIAEKWSINPAQLRKNYKEKSTGILGILKA